MKVILGLLIIVGLVVFTKAQTTTLNGVVYSNKGSRIKGATVKLAGKFGKEYMTKTDDEGVYQVELPYGIYKLDFTSPRFTPFTIYKYTIVKTDSKIMYLDVVLEAASR